MIKKVNGKWMMSYTKLDGTEGWQWINSPAAKKQQEAYQQERAKFFADNHYQSSKDYSSSYDGLFGGSKGPYDYTHSFGSGPNQSWEGALENRLRLRKEGQQDGASSFEVRTYTTDKDYQKNMYARNNAIEDMYRRGYSMDQIRDHVEGRVSINSVNPDYSDYFSHALGEISSGQSEAAGMLQYASLSPEEWMKDYFQFDHDTAMAGRRSQGGNSQAAQMLMQGINNSSNQGSSAAQSEPPQSRGRGQAWGPGNGMLGGETNQMRQAIVNQIQKKLVR